MLVYGATGRAGRLVAERALSQGWSVAAFVRNPDKVPEALRSQMTLVQGDLRDAASISAAVRSTRPNAIVDASSALPFGHAKGQPANNADRGVITKATVRALDADGRLADCVLLVIGGQLIPEPGGTIDKLSVAAVAWALRTFVMRKEWREAQEVLRWSFQDTPSAFRFVYARLGQMVERPSRGALHAEPTQKNIQHGSVSYCDVADVLVRLASDEARTWERKAVFFNYRTP
jgi:NAD(P)-dependent dehydrogenase (short-subunit alcohol dehydrogenase family)